MRIVQHGWRLILIEPGGLARRHNRPQSWSFRAQPSNHRGDLRYRGLGPVNAIAMELVDGEDLSQRSAGLQARYGEW
jgi:hypothetical protein